MPLLNEHFPEYILRYSLETAMIIDSPIYSLKHRNINLHLYSFFKHPPKVNLIHPPILCAIYTIYIDRFISMLPPIPLIVLYYVTYALVVISILFLALFISNHAQIFSIIFSISTIILIYFIYKIYLIHSRPSIPTITFMISYIKFVNYPRDYNYIFDLFWPKPSPFVNIINRDIYKTWNGEALINFKWNAYGKYYYFIICNLFMALFLCFTAVATIPQDYLNENLKRNVLKTSITLGSFHLIQEIRQFIYNPKKWFLNYWNFFDLEHLNHLNASFIQAPDENTNMFTDYGTALFAIYLFLTGDPSALSNKWAYKEHPALIILIVLFSFMIVVYLMNLFIGLLNKAIEKDNNRISYLMQKAEV
ncbi:hypothetical protein GLOIN_2v807942 [Rhizophagus irregularis DAOM 181602=DAOM 197198]|uniref:Ion transport domain-containing protein n=1 Tax=Rhizophagus irregularis (strain DAOM 181602 / DAOM 197198 / MUCL 43194) TaxID=747089 RepID=A0A2P4QIB5_RHIID|nr:hypothetical protein GLOIN_2v807942 [Rhizophagus irregularis DAOM 181602=DAOM 197198]POG77389.1 hypothetical protein GLOIN_2v807942 [Rhizophagus irregularis DAOM 181602=DAOM 197198]|eukprot:XP_025184255.1 hypothetical protein GLOIN_2v807942 [Rhizophagus irregularis DAOM 181602=DAOM 197198]